MTQYPPPPPPLPPFPPGYLPYAQPGYFGPRRPGILTAACVIGIIFASICLLCGPIGFIPYFISPALPAIEAIKQNHDRFVIMMSLAFVRILLGGVLLVASIGGLNLKNWARQLFLFYALAAILIYAGDILEYCFWILPVTAHFRTKAPSGFRTGVKIGAFVGMFLPIFYCICVIAVMKSQRVIDALAADGTPGLPPWQGPSPIR